LAKVLINREEFDTDTGIARQGSVHTDGRGWTRIRDNLGEIRKRSLP
jgi:hypothetical protein